MPNDRAYVSVRRSFSRDRSPDLTPIAQTFGRCYHTWKRNIDGSESRVRRAILYGAVRSAQCESDTTISGLQCQEILQTGALLTSANVAETEEKGVFSRSRTHFSLDLACPHLGHLRRNLVRVLVPT